MAGLLQAYTLDDLLRIVRYEPHRADDARAEIMQRSNARIDAEARCRTSPAMQSALDRIAAEIPPIAAKLHREARDHELNSLRTQFARLPYLHPARDGLIRKMQARKDALAAEAGVEALTSERSQPTFASNPGKAA